MGRRRGSKNTTGHKIASPRNIGSTGIGLKHQQSGRGKQASPSSIVELYLLESISFDWAQLVVLGQSFVKESVIAIEQIGDRSVFLDHRNQNDWIFSDHRLSQRFIELRKSLGVRLVRLDFAERKPLGKKIVDQSELRRSRNIRLAWATKTSLSLSLPRAACSNNFESGGRDHRKKLNGWPIHNRLRDTGRRGIRRFFSNRIKNEGEIKTAVIIWPTAAS